MEVFIPFPLQGIDKQAAFQAGDQQSAPNASNVVSMDASDQRIRGGSRPGLEKRYPDAMDGIPTFMEVVSTTSDQRGPIYQRLVVATEESIYVSTATEVVGTDGSVSYDERLDNVSGVILTEDGEEILTEEGDEIVLSGLDFGTINRGSAVAYQGGVVIAGDGTVLKVGTGTVSSNVLTDGTVANWKRSALTRRITWLRSRITRTHALF